MSRTFDATGGGTRVVDGLCGICPAGCWIRAHLDGGRLVGVEPRPDSPMGAICHIGTRSPDIVHDPNRLRHPLRRVGPRGAGEFERIGWDEAMAHVAAEHRRIKRDHGAEATAIYTGRGSFDMAMCDLFQPAGVPVSSACSVLFPFGSPNTLGVGALCYVSFAMIAPHTTFGELYITLAPDIEQADLVVVWGANPATDSPPLHHAAILDARRRGAEVVCIDPRRNATARETDARWIPIRSGTDGALALGMIRVMLEEELHDEAFARRWTVGFNDLAQLVQHYRPEVVESITSVPAETVRELARRVAGARGAAPVMYTGLEYSDSGVQAIRAVFTLWALAGQLDVPGGLTIRMRENTFPQNRTGLVENPDPGRALGRDRFPVYSMYRGESHAIALPRSVLEGEPYRVRSLVVVGGSLITAWPQPELWRRTLSSLEHLVVMDRTLTADAMYADVVLPATTYYEITSYMRYGPQFTIRERLVEPQGEARSDFLVLAELARRLGYGHLYPQSEEQILRHALEGSGFTLEQVRARGGSVRVPTAMMEYRKWEKGRLRDDGEPGFATPSGRFEIASGVLAEHGYDPLPVYTEPAEGPLSRPDLARSYPLVFNSGSRTVHDFRSQHHGVESLVRNLPEPLVTMSTADAATRSITDGDPVVVSTPRGRVRFRAHVTDDMAPGGVDAMMGGGGPLGPEAWRRSNVNELTDIERFDPISGFPVYKTLLCEVTREAGAEGAGPVELSETGEARIPGPEPTPDVPFRHVYMDHNATTPVAPEVRAAMRPFLEDECGNPSSVHARGAAARDAVESARRAVAQVLGCTARRVVFTGSGTESDNMAVLGAARARRSRGRHVITSAVEHPAVLEACRALGREGFDVTVLPVDGGGRVATESLERALRPDTVLVSVMTANNELGTVQPVAELAALARDRGALVHTDAVQALGKLPLGVEELGVDLLSVSGHKIHGPKGVGALYVRRDVELEPLVHGGGQEGGLRPGTENVPGIVGLGRACQLAERGRRAGRMERLAALCDDLARGVADLVEGARVNGDPHHRLAHTLSVTLPGIRGESLVLMMDRRGVRFSSGSACKSGNPDPSHALLATGMDDAHCTVRFSLGPDNTREDVDHVLEALADVLATTASSLRFVSCR
jgi:cysteine desulfurase NifS